jgi:ABC-type spermidine/putrescine transport system permease subunit I
MTGPSVRRRWRRDELALLALSIPALTIIALALIVPFAWLAGLSFESPTGAITLNNYFRIFGDASYAQSFWLTTWMAALVTAICAVCGYLVAYAMTLMPRWAARICLVLVAVPFWTSTLVRTYSWLVLLQNEGVINKILLKLGVISAPLHMMYNLTGTLIGMVHIMLPFMVFPLYAGLRRLDPDYVKAAIGLGASPLYSFWRIYFPLSLPGLVAGCVMVMIISLGFYITPALLGGGHVIVLALAFQRDLDWNQSWGPAAAAAVLFVLLIVGAVACLSRTVSIERSFER